MLGVESLWMMLFLMLVNESISALMDVFVCVAPASVFGFCDKTLHSSNMLGMPILEKREITSDDPCFP